MSILISKIETLFLEGSLEAICFAIIIYLTRKGTTILPLNDIKGFLECAVNASLEKITDFERKMKVLEVLTQQMLSAELARPSLFCVLLLKVRDAGPEERCGLDTVKGLNVEQEAIPNHSREEIDQNLRALQSKLGAPIADTDISLYSALKTNLISIDHSELTWRDPEANMIIADDSVLVKNLGQRQMQVFLEPRESMKCILPTSITSKCVEFSNNFNRADVSKVLRNVVHNKEWKEKESKLIKRTNHILGVLEGVWNNPAFASSEIRGTQSEGTYVTDIIVPLLRASLEDLPNGGIFLSTAERQSMASKARKSFGPNEERSTHKTPIGKKPDVMVMAKYGGKIFELAYVESSRILCTRSKREDDSVKLWREALDGISFVGVACRPTNNQFGIVGIQVAGEDLYLNILVKDASGIPRYFYVNQVEISFTKNTSWRVEPLIRLLLTLRNIMIVNQSLLIQALEQANTRPPRNATQSPTVIFPSHK
ncbi:hypothetical protein Glove_78g202 [Diversispora epigaea]|uniref:Uncharacterized protein n=1 Tax=Diversispora epigaea TaxID=1348612 RepID=A0A397J8P5_9GLOM|nr:hypothetical protein Glove_78g202 [Diversispora epigaea]